MKVKGLRWWIIALICIATVINYIDRTAFGVMWPEIGQGPWHGRGRLRRYAQCFYGHLCPW